MKRRTKVVSLQRLSIDSAVVLFNSLIMFKKQFFKRPLLRFKHFARKNYALFSCLGKEVLIGVLSVATLSSAQAKIAELPVPVEDSVARSNVNLDEVVVTAARAPLTQMQSAKIVSIISRDDIHRASVETINDVLKMATGVDVRQRGGFGVQTDVSINGGTFDQITILLNGVDISSPQTGHNAADFPVSVSDIERIEVLEGAASRVVGSTAFCGAINIVTTPSDLSGVRLSAEGGMYGTYAADATVNYAASVVQNKISAGYTQSEGAIDNGDFVKWNAFYQGKTALGESSLRWQAGWSSRDFGANTFYSAKFNNQYEETRRLLGSVNGDLHILQRKGFSLSFVPQLSWHRDYDHYQLIRGMTGSSNGENYHRTEAFGAGNNINVDWKLGKTSLGVDVRREKIVSTALGEPQQESEWLPVSGSERYYEGKGERLNTSLFFEHTALLRFFTLSAGLLANSNTGLDNDFRFYPGVDVAWIPTASWKAFASYNKALRLPTYTDLYINNKVQRGDVHLLPEQNSMYKCGVRYRRAGVEAVVSAFYSRGINMIDWAYETEESTCYHAMNIGRLDNRGVSVDLHFGVRELLPKAVVKDVKLGYAFIDQSYQTERPIFRSLYALEYLRHKFVAQVDHVVWKDLSASWNFRWQKRMNGYEPYGKLDCKVLWHRQKYDVYVKGDNLTNHRYYDIGEVLQPGLWVMAGAVLRL